MRSSTVRFAILGMSLSVLLDITAAHDFLRGLLSLLQEYDTVTDENLKARTVYRSHTQAAKQADDQCSATCSRRARASGLLVPLITRSACKIRAISHISSLQI